MNPFKNLFSRFRADKESGQEAMDREAKERDDARTNHNGHDEFVYNRMVKENICERDERLEEELGRINESERFGRTGDMIFAVIVCGVSGAGITKILDSATLSPSLMLAGIGTFVAGDAIYILESRKSEEKRREEAKKKVFLSHKTVFREKHPNKDEIIYSSYVQSHERDKDYKIVKVYLHVNASQENDMIHKQLLTLGDINDFFEESIKNGKGLDGVLRYKDIEMFVPEITGDTPLYSSRRKGSEVTEIQRPELESVKQEPQKEKREPVIREERDNIISFEQIKREAESKKHSHSKNHHHEHDDLQPV